MSLSSACKPTCSEVAVFFGRWIDGQPVINFAGHLRNVEPGLRRHGDQNYKRGKSTLQMGVHQTPSRVFALHLQALGPPSHRLTSASCRYENTDALAVFGQIFTTANRVINRSSQAAWMCHRQVRSWHASRSCRAAAEHDSLPHLRHECWLYNFGWRLGTV